MYEVLPGPHQVAATLTDIDAKRPQLRQADASGASACFEAKPASVYTVSTSVQDWRLRTTVLDRDSGEDVETACAASSAEASTPTRKPERIETPPVFAHPADADGDSDVGRPHPWGGFRLGVGDSFGGDSVSLYGTEGPAAGSGRYLTFGGTLMPVWIGGLAGIGMGGSFGLKYSGGDRGDLSRLPTELWLEILLRVSPRWFVALAGGRHKDYDISWGTDASFGCRWGRMFDLGLYAISSRHVAWGFGIHYVDLQYTFYSATLDAGSVGLDLRMYVNP